MVKLYDNLKGLSDSCVRGGVTTEPALIEDFGRGFNSSYPLFEFVDIGPFKESAHDKIGGECISCLWLGGCVLCFFHHSC